MAVSAEAGRNGTLPRLLDHNGRPFHQDYGDMALPHVLTFPSLYGSAWHTYLHGKFDESIRTNRRDALVMRRDAYLMALLWERKVAVSSLKWHLEVDDEKDPWQKSIKEGLTKALRATPRLERMFLQLLEAVWYGRYGVQIRYEWKTLNLPTAQAAPVFGGGMPNGSQSNAGQFGGDNPRPGKYFRPNVFPGAEQLPNGQQGASPFGVPAMGAVQATERRRCLVVAEHQPVNGDKIGFQYDGTPYVHVYSAARQSVKDAEFILSTDANAMLLKGSWRQRFILHTHESDDADYFDAEAAGAIGGIGIRHRIYWLDWLKREYLAMLVEHIQRKGLGVMLYWYNGSNPEAKTRALEAAKEQSWRSIILLPTWQSDRGTPLDRVECVECPVSGAELLIKLQDYVDRTLERYIVGQSMSSGKDGEDGLGGTGRAKFAGRTKNQNTRYDADNLAETLTADWVETVKRWTYPEAAEIPVRFRFNIDDEDPAEKLEAVKVFVGMGGTVREDEVRELTGLSDPQPGDATLGGQQMMLAKEEAGAKPNPFGGSGEGGDGPEDEDGLPFAREGRPARYGAGGPDVRGQLLGLLAQMRDCPECGPYQDAIGAVLESGDLRQMVAVLSSVLENYPEGLFRSRYAKPDRYAGFDPGQPRDDVGKWTGGGAIDQERDARERAAARKALERSDPETERFLEQNRHRAAAKVERRRQKLEQMAPEQRRELSRRKAAMRETESTVGEIRDLIGDVGSGEGDLTYPAEYRVDYLADQAFLAEGVKGHRHRVAALRELVNHLVVLGQEYSTAPADPELSEHRRERVNAVRKAGVLALRALRWLEGK